MAKKRKTTKRRTTRRRMGSVGHRGLQGDIMEIGGLVLGSVAATMVQRHTTSMNPKVVSGVQILAGYYMKNHATSPLLRGAGYGMLGAGAIGLTHQVGLIHGLDDMVGGLYSGAYMSGGEQLDMPDNMSGFGNNEYVNGLYNGARVAGNDNIEPVGM